MDKNQIAAEAALDFINKWWPDCPKTLQPELQRAFQSAIEKATEELANKIQWAKTDSYTEGYNKALGEWLRGENPCRAAHASEQGADDKAALAERLFKAWAKYEQFFQEPPHGTLKQLRAMLELMPPSQRPTPATEGKEI